jgi:hypothetical protein
MKTTVENQAKKQVPLVRVAQGRNDKESLGHEGRLGPNDKVFYTTTADSWARVCATGGAGVWAIVAVLARLGIARIGAIELLFLFGPLVIVPLGMELGRTLGAKGRLEGWAGWMQPFGTLLAIAALWLPPGRAGGFLALGWMFVCVLTAGGGIVGLVQASWLDVGGGARAEFPSRFTLITLRVAQIDLAVGGAWFVASRFGMRPMGIQEPIGLLTAVHFHFAGFATATIAAATVAFAEKHGIHRWLKPLVLMVVGMPFVVAAGFVISPALKMGAGVLFAASVAGLAIALRGCGRLAGNPSTRLFLQIAAAAVFAGMVLAAAYAVADFTGSDVLTIPQMARTHGILNAFGFCLLGLLGWLVESSRES